MKKQEFIDCEIHGEVRNTIDITRETSGPAYDANFVNYWKRKNDIRAERIEPGMMISLHEDAFRNYGDRTSGKMLRCTVDGAASGQAHNQCPFSDIYMAKTRHERCCGYNIRPPDATNIVDAEADI
jgi:hypothetical protein